MRDANNCNILTVTCTAQAGGQVFMQALEQGIEDIENASFSSM